MKIAPIAAKIVSGVLIGIVVNKMTKPVEDSLDEIARKVKNLKADPTK